MILTLTLTLIPRRGLGAVEGGGVVSFDGGQLNFKYNNYNIRTI
jgi:hypothetical protein